VQMHGIYRRHHLLLSRVAIKEIIQPPEVDAGKTNLVDRRHPTVKVPDILRFFHKSMGMPADNQVDIACRLCENLVGNFTFLYL
jgi:hypothetical protein